MFRVNISNFSLKIGGKIDKNPSLQLTVLSIPWFWVWTDEDSSKSFGLETSWSVYTINLMITCINMAKYSCLWMDFSFVRRLLKEKMKRNDAVLQWKIVFPFHSSTCTSSSSVTNSSKKYFATNFSLWPLFVAFFITKLWPCYWEQLATLNAQINGHLLLNCVLPEKDRRLARFLRQNHENYVKLDIQTNRKLNLIWQ